MSPIRIVLGVLAASLAVPALALPAPTTYAINGSPTSTTGALSWNNTASTFYGVNGSLYGNSYTWGTGAASMTMTAWANTGASSQLQSAWIGNYDPAGLGITSRPVAGNTNELTSSSHNPNTTGGQHAIDNSGAYESMLFSFQSSVTLDTVSIGYAGADTDATVFVYTGTGDPTAGPGLSVRTYADMLTNGWQIAGNLFNMKTSGPSTVPTTLSSKYWMVGAFMNLGGNTQIGGNDSTADFFKISSITATPKLAVPEPSSIALFGIASMGLLVRRRRPARAV